MARFDGIFIRLFKNLFQGFSLEVLNHSCKVQIEREKEGEDEIAIEI